MIKLQDFAALQGVTDRQIQRLIAKYPEELNGLYQRKGPNGTWLTDEACEILRGKMKQQAVVVYDDRVNVLEAENKELQAKLIAAYENMTRIQERQIDLTRQVEEQRLLASKTESERERADRAEERARAAEDIAEAAGQEAEAAKQHADELQTMLDQIAGAGWIERRRILRGLKKEARQHDQA